MKLNTLFSRSNGQGKEGRSAKRGLDQTISHSEAPPPAYISGQDTGGQAHNDHFMQTSHARYEANPHLSVIQALQNEPAAKKTFFSGLRLLGQKPVASGPDSLRPYALYELGFTQDPKRAAKIAKGLTKVGVFDKTGALMRRDAPPDKVIDRLRDSRFSGVKKLTAQEAQGVKIYLEGHFENLHLLGQDVHQVPAHLRSDWLFFANITVDKENSRFLMSTMRKHQVLDRNFLPIHGGARYDLFAKEATEYYQRTHPRWAHENKDSLIDMLHTVRGILFPLPAYESAPGYRP